MAIPGGGVMVSEKIQLNIEVEAALRAKEDGQAGE